MMLTWIDAVRKHRDSIDDRTVIVYDRSETIDGIVWLMNGEGDKLKQSDFDEIEKRGEAHIIG